MKTKDKMRRAIKDVQPKDAMAKRPSEKPMNTMFCDHLQEGQLDRLKKVCGAS